MLVFPSHSLDVQSSYGERSLMFTKGLFQEQISAIKNTRFARFCASHITNKQNAFEEMANKKAKKDLNCSSQKHIAKFSDETLEKMSIQDFNKQLRQIPEGLKQKYRKRRRILKNRKYALKCRRKGSEATDNIAEQNKALELEISRVSEELQKVTNERDELKVKCARLNAMLSGMQSPARRRLPDNSRASQQM